MSLPVKFKELTISNFMAFGNNVNKVNLDFKKPVLIIGENHDAMVDGQLDSNGAGKSSIIEALTFALYDKTISDKEKTGLLNNINKKNLEVSVTFEKNKQNYKVVRMRKTKTKADIKLLKEINGSFENEKSDITPDSIDNTNKKIAEILGFPFDIFARIIVVSAEFQPFLDLPSRHNSKTSQTSIMEELFGYTVLTEKAESLKKNIKNTKDEFNHLKDLQEQIQQEKERHKTQIESTKERIKKWKEENKEKIKTAEKELNELVNIDLDQERENVRKIESIKTEIVSLESEQKVLESELKNLKDQLKNYNDKKERIEKITNKVKEIEEKVDFDHEENIFKELKEKEKELDSQNDEYGSINSNIKKLNNDIEKNNKEIESLESNVCPYCKQTFKDTDSKLKHLRGEINSFNNDLNEKNVKLKSLNDDIEKLTKNINDLKGKSVFNNEKDLTDLKTKYEQYKTQLESYTEDDIDDDINDKIYEKENGIDSIIEKIKNKNDNIEKIKSQSKFDNITDIERTYAKINHLEEKIESLSNENNPYTETLKELQEVTFDHDKTKRLNELENDLKHQEYLLKLLTKKDSFVRKNLLDKNLPFLNKRLMMYLEKLGLPHRVEFQSDMTAKISQFGTELDFSSLSAGQKARVNFALSFAFRDVLQARYGKISFCMLDECLDTGLGNVGIQLAIKMLKDIATTEKMSMFVVSHRDEIASMFEDKMIVQLKNGFSNIV